MVSDPSKHPVTQKKPPKRPESVLVVVATRGGEVLMLNRVQPRGFWQSVTGSLKWHEAPRQAAVRELLEETGLGSCGWLVDVRHRARFPIKPAWRKRYAASAHYNLEHRFYCILPGRRTIRRNPQEHCEMRWLPVQRAASLAASWTNRDAILALPRIIAGILSTP